MRTAKTILLALFCVAALVTFACGRGQEHTGQVSQETPSQTAQTQTAQAPAPPAVPQSQPPVNELRQLPQSVQIHEEAPPAVDHGQESSQLDSRERSLAAREAEIAARERQLRQNEQQAHAGKIRVTPRPRRPAPAPAPVPDRSEIGEASAPAPNPGPEPAREEPAPAPIPQPAESPVEAPRTVDVSLPAGTALDVEFRGRLASNLSAPGDTFRVRVAQDVREEGGVVAIPRGSEIVGVVTEAVPLPRVGGRAKLGLRFTDLVLPSGSTVPIHASLIQQGRNKTGRDAATIGGAAAGGAILGNILGKGDRGKASVIGAIIGAIAGTAIASKTPGEEIVIPEGTVLGLRLNDSIEVRARVRP